MSDKRLPFLMKALPCPACGTTADHRQMRSRAYGPGKTESDNHVLTYIWSDPDYIQVHPPLYFLYYCTACSFAAPAENFADPETILHKRVGIKAFQAAREGGDKVIALLAKHIDYHTLNFESALWMHLLATYIHLLREDAYRDHYTIGRLYLRIAWLYREANVAKDSAEAPGASGSNGNAGGVSKALREFDAVLHQCNEIRDRVAVAIKEQAASTSAKDAEVYANSLSRAERLLEALHSESYRLKSAYNRSSSGSPTHANDRSYSLDFLDALKEEWVYAPADEIEAMRSTIEYLEKAIASDSRLSGHEAFFRTSALIVDLELRSNDLDAAFKKVRGIVESVIQDKEAIARRVAKTEDQSHKMELLKMLSSAGKTLDRANDLRFDVLDRLIEREMPKISKILRENSKSTAGQKKVALLSNGISHGIIHHLEERKML